MKHQFIQRSGNVTDKESSAGSHTDMIVVILDQAVGGHCLQLWPEFVEIAAKIDVESLFDPLEYQAEIADQMLNHFPAPLIHAVYQFRFDVFRCCASESAE